MTFDDLLFNSFETVLIASFQYALVDNDIQNTQDSSKKQYKRTWRDKWLEQYNKSLKENSDNDAYNEVITISQELDRSIEEFKQDYVDAIYARKARLIILELISFTPYYQLSESKQEEQNKWKDLKINTDPWNTKLKNIATKLGLDSDLPRYYSECFKAALNNISGNKQKMIAGVLGGGLAVAVTGGLAATAIAPIFAASGLSGAAAISSGLATLGGGAIAAGGFGMAGGFAVIVGGGALIGGAGGLGIASLIKNPNFVLYESAKMEVFAKEIAIREQKDFGKVQDIIKSLNKRIEELQEELDDLKSNSNYKNQNSEESFTQEQINKVITYLIRVRDRIRSFKNQWT